LADGGNATFQRWTSVGGSAFAASFGLGLRGFYGRRGGSGASLTVLRRCFRLGRRRFRRYRFGRRHGFFGWRRGRFAWLRLGLGLRRWRRLDRLRRYGFRRRQAQFRADDALFIVTLPFRRANATADPVDRHEMQCHGGCANGNDAAAVAGKSNDRHGR